MCYAVEVCNEKAPATKSFASPIEISSIAGRRITPLHVASICTKAFKVSREVSTTNSGHFATSLDLRVTWTDGHELSGRKSERKLTTKRSNR